MKERLVHHQHPDSTARSARGAPESEAEDSFQTAADIGLSPETYELLEAKNIAEPIHLSLLTAQDVNEIVQTRGDRSRIIRIVEPANRRARPVTEA